MIGLTLEEKGNNMVERIRSIDCAGSWVALITPMTSEGGIDLETFKKLVCWHYESGTNGIIIAGTTGEAPTLSSSEKLDLLQTALEETARLKKREAGNTRRFPIVLNVGSNDTYSSVDLAQKAALLGVHGVMVVAPYYNCPPEAGIIAHFLAIGQVGLPIIAYHVPKRTGGVGITPKVAQHLFEKNIICALKEASGDLVSYMRFVDMVPAMPLLVGDDELLLPSFSAGAVGVISVMANLLPRQWSFLCGSSVRNGKLIEDARDLIRSYRPLMKAIGSQVNPIGIKCAMEQAGLISSQRVRLPLVPASEEAALWIQKELECLPSELNFCRV
jgi:4-hydroxy-tetrahydrodipicolinate synthase